MNRDYFILLLAYFTANGLSVFHNQNVSRITVTLFYVRGTIPFLSQSLAQKKKTAQQQFAD